MIHLTKRLFLSLVLLVATVAYAAKQEVVFERLLPGYSKNLHERADQALDDTFIFQGIVGSPFVNVSEFYDWNHSGPKDDKEWAWFLNRHRFFENLYLAYQKTGDARYTAKIFQILEDWLAEHAEPPKGVSFSSAWRPLEAARRILESWDIVYLKLWNNASFTDELKADFLVSLTHHGDYLHDHHALYGNHLITEMIALLKVSLLLPDAKNSAQWQSYALKRLSKEYDKQVYPEGAHKELSSHYQRVVALNYEKLLSLLEVSGQTELLKLWRPKVDRLWKYFSAIRKPSGFAPLNNDSDLENVTQLLEQNGRNKSPHLRQSVYFPNAGQVILQSASPSTAPLWSFFDIGPRGSDHQHEDFMHLSLSYGNFDILVDNGRYTYQPGKWRDYFQGPRGHNILLVDGKRSQPKPNIAKGALKGTGFYSGEKFEAAWGSASFADTLGNETANWQRVIIHLPGSHLLVLDHIITFQERTIEGFWHGAPDTEWDLNPSAISLKKDRLQSKITYANSSNKILINSLQFGKNEKKISGWHSPRFNVKNPTHCLNYTATISAPTTFAWLFSNTTQSAILKKIGLSGKDFHINYETGDDSFEAIGNFPDNTQKLTLAIERKD